MIQQKYYLVLNGCDGTSDVVRQTLVMMMKKRRPVSQVYVLTSGDGPLHLNTEGTQSVLESWSNGVMSPTG